MPISSPPPGRPRSRLRHTLLASLLPALSVSPALAAEEQELAPVLVTTATRTEHDITTTPAPIQLISQAEIESMGATTLRDIMDLASGVYVSPGGTNLQIRGLGHSDTVYLLDGHRIKGEFSNTYELERINAAMIERIEILRGPASVLYGADALGGVVNIITRKPKAGLEIGADIQYGANDAGRGGRSMAAFDLRGGNDLLRYSLYTSLLRRDPYAEHETTRVTVPQSGIQVSPSSHSNPLIRNRLPNSYGVDVDYRDEARVDTLGGRLELTPRADLKLGLEFNYLDEHRESDFISSRYATTVMASGKAIQAANIPARQFDDNNRLDTAATLAWSPSADLDLNYSLHYSRYEKDREIRALHYADLGYLSSSASASSQNRSTLSHLTHELTSVWRPGSQHTLVAGLEHRDNKVKSTAYSADGRTYQSAFLQHEWRLLSSLNLVYGARYDDISVGGSHVSLQAGGVWSASPLARLRVNYAQGFKAPDDRNLYVDQVNPQGVAMLGAQVINLAQGKTSAHSLKPEISDTFEVGLAGGTEQWSYGITAFHTEIEDRIEQVRETVGSSSYNTFRNISAARIRGVEAEGSIRLARNLRARLNLTQLEARNRSTDTTLLNTPETLASLSFDYTPAPAWMLQAIVRHAGKQDYSGTSGTETAAAYTLLHLKASYMAPALQGLEIYGGINNVLNEKIDTALGSDPGPYGYLGVRYRF